MIYLLNAYWLSGTEGGEIPLLCSRNRVTVEGLKAAYEVLIKKVEEEHRIVTERIFPGYKEWMCSTSVHSFEDGNYELKHQRDQEVRDYAKKLLPILEKDWPLLGALVESIDERYLSGGENDWDRLEFTITEVEEV